MPPDATAPENLFHGENAAYIEELFQQYQESPESVTEEWRAFFAKTPMPTPPAASPPSPVDSPPASKPAAKQDAKAATARHAAAAAASSDVSHIEKQYAVVRLINRYRLWGARKAKINPLDYEGVQLGHFDLQQFGLGDADLQTVFITDMASLPAAPLAEIIAHLEAVYCGTCVCECNHLSDHDEQHWLRERFESRPADRNISSKARIRLLKSLVAAESLEKYLHTRYTGQKRFSLEGGDALIPLLDTILTCAGERGVVETVLGMAHRGRLNVLVNILGKSPADLFMEFEGKHDSSSKSGDVKYHMGFSSTLKTSRGQMHLALTFNPSHLEIVNPVVEGSVRARQDRQNNRREIVLPLLIHGDAAFAGQGVIMEGFNISQVRGYKTGGSLHVIVNNQIGFTTSTPDDARSTFFSSDIAKMAEVPIIHVNCDDVDAVAYAAQVAVAYRQQFGKDILIDLVCFRRHGHNEQDEPLVTQPLMYKKIANHPGTPAVYAKRLVADGVVTTEQVAQMQSDYKARLEGDKPIHPDVLPTESSKFVDWSRYAADGQNWDWTPETPLAMATLQALGKKLSTFPDGFSPHPVLQRLVRNRREMAAGKRPLDWGMAENLSYATLLAEGGSIRLSGQDCGRGTFAHRHAVWHDQSRAKRDGGSYVPLRHLSKQQGDFLVIDSILSEEAILAFEYGYATTSPGTLVVWEAQFGDFANGAQVVIDQFISSGEAKWERYCGLVMLLPHGYEGQGPEHSSARLERYLQLCAEYNLQVCVPSSPAQIFHLLRRQLLRPLRRPLVVISPKSLLRHPEAVSSLGELANGRFEPALDETDAEIEPSKVDKVVFCSGKIYYELRAQRAERKIRDIALCRLEQLYPFPHDYVQRILNKYDHAPVVTWCQEEPGNQGAWHRLQHYFRRHLLDRQILNYALRPSSASPAVGYAKIHKQQQQEVIDAALSAVRR